MIAEPAPQGTLSLKATQRSLAILGGLLLACALAQNGFSHAQKLPPTWWMLMAQVPIYFLACWLVVRGTCNRNSMLLIFAVAVVARVIAWWPEPYLSNDIYRYIWDGRVQAAGINPYRHVPHDPELVQLRDEAIYGKMNRKDYAPTIYPPGAEMAFFLITRISEKVGWMRLCLMGFEGVTAWAVMQLLRTRGLPTQRVLLYAWHPLVIWEFVGNGHIDALMIAFIALALVALLRQRRGWLGAALAGAVLVKLYPVILFPAFYRRWEWKMPAVFCATIAAAYAVYSSVGERVLGFLPDYAKEEGIENGRRFFLAGMLREFTGVIVSPQNFKLAAMATLGLIGLAAFWRRRFDLESTLRFSAALGIAFMFFLSPNYPWYYSWLILFLVFLRWAVLYWLTAASFFLYISWSAWYDLNEYEMNRLFLPVGIILVGYMLCVSAIRVWRKGTKRTAASAP